MTVLPYQVPVAEQLTLADFGRAAVTSHPAVDGTCTAALVAVPDGETWRVERIVVSCDSATGTVARVYAGAPADRNLVDATASGNLDIADEAQPVLLVHGEELTCVWTGASDGAVGTMHAQWSVFERRSG